MIRHSGACFLLSTLILVLAALVFYRSEVPEEAEAPREVVVEATAEAEPPRETPEAGPRERVDAEPETALLRPQAPLTMTEPEETLSDVAKRVYGSSEAAEWLRRANPDRVERIDLVLKPGLVLRTPDLRSSDAW